MENSFAGITSTSCSGTPRTFQSSQRLARPCAEHHLTQHNRRQPLRRNSNAFLSLPTPSRKHCRRRIAGQKHATTCIAAPEIAERTFAEGKVRKVPIDSP